MLLNNATNLLKSLAIIGGATRSGKVYDLMYPVIDTSGNAIQWWSGIVGTAAYGNSSTYRCNVDPFSSTSLNVQTSYNSGYKGINVLVGSGTTPVTADDYILESLITTVEKQNSSVVIDYKIDNDSKSIATKMTIKVAIKNTGTENITISEIGLYETPYTGSGSNSSKCVLLYREVLNNPITLAPEEFSTFQIVIDIVHS